MAVPRKKGRHPRYWPEVTEALARVWEAGDRMCGKLLVAILPDLLGSLERHGELHLASREGEALLSMSAATIDRRLRGWRRGVARQPRRHAGATTDLKAQIPIRTWSEWRDACPGSVQADLVLHCGDSVEGFFRPVRKLVGKERRGARVTKLYDAPRTPYQRLLQSGILDMTTQQRLQKQFLAINPAQLQRSIERALRGLWRRTDRSERAKAG